MSGCCRKIFNNGLNSKAVWFFFPPHIPAMNQGSEISAYFRQTESFPAWITSKLSMNFLAWEKNPIISVAIAVVYFIMGTSASFTSRFMCSSGQFSAIRQSQPPQKATTVGTDEDTLG